MTHTTEEFVRRELQSILRGDTNRNRFVCLLGTNLAYSIT